MCPGVDSASKNEYQDTPGSKAGRCVRLTTYHLLVPNVKKIQGVNLPDPHGPVQACSGTALPLLLLTAIGLSPGGSSPTLVQTKIKIHKTTLTTKQLQNIKKPKTTK
jgi:hypothetical protein